MLVKKEKNKKTKNFPRSRKSMFKGPEVAPPRASLHTEIVGGGGNTTAVGKGQATRYSIIRSVHSS